MQSFFLPDWMIICNCRSLLSVQDVSGDTKMLFFGLFLLTLTLH